MPVIKNKSNITPIKDLIKLSDNIQQFIKEQETCVRIQKNLKSRKEIIINQAKKINITLDQDLNIINDNQQNKFLQSLESPQSPLDNLTTQTPTKQILQCYK